MVEEGKNLKLYAIVDKEVVENLVDGINFCRVVPVGSTHPQNLIIYVEDVTSEGSSIGPEYEELLEPQSDGCAYKVLLNKCKHAGGLFIRDIEDDVVKCSFHGWKLNVKTCAYLHNEELHQNILPCNITEEGRMEIYITQSKDPWEIEAKNPEALIPNELTVTYIAHACIKVKCGSKTIFTDPWLCGPAFMTGWWLRDAVPKKYFNEVATADAIYISHSHEDHLNWHTLKEIAEIIQQLTYM